MAGPEVFENGRVKAWVSGVPFEDEAKAQTFRAAALPFIHKHIAVMPDVHGGIGATVGTVMATKGAIVPAAVGVDIGCGMAAIRTTLVASNLPENLHGIRTAIETAVPHGRTDSGGPNDRGAWGNAPDFVCEAWRGLEEDYWRVTAEHVKASHRRPLHQLGTLGTGNHFIEICLDEEQRVWVMLHSGSRGAGNAIGSYFIARAKEEMARWFIHVPHPDLAYLPEHTSIFESYLRAVEWAQRYAATNRAIMMRSTLAAIEGELGRAVIAREVAVECHHNYVARERHFGADVLVTRKGAVRAGLGELGIIPGSMGAQSFIVRGKGNRESFESCSHGAGRVMSRTAARATFSLSDHVAATDGVECRKDEGVLDETPAAYKSIAAVMAAQSDLVDVVHVLKQIVCVKG